jgi:hypothetical protein
MLGETATTPAMHTYSLPISSPHPDPTVSNLCHNLWSHRFYKRLIGPLNPLENNGLLIATSIQEGSLLTCCDGSYSPFNEIKFTWLGTS